MNQYYKFDQNDRLRSKFFMILLVVCEILTIVCAIFLGRAAYTEHQKVEELQSKSNTYYDEAVQNQLKYEETLDDRNKLEKDLDDANRRLSEAAERERAAKVRASRSRRPVPSVERTSAPSPRSVAVGGSVHDITMYCPTGNTTASGKTPRRGMVATISRSIPFGTRVSIEGLGTFTVEDRIGHGSEFDIFTPSCAEADRFGRHHALVTILG